MSSSILLPSAPLSHIARVGSRLARITRIYTCCAQSNAPPSQEARGRHIAQLAVADFVQSGYVIGIGDGVLATNYALQEISRLLVAGELQAVRCLPGSDVAAVEAAVAGVPLVELNQDAKADVTLCQADELDPRGLAFLTGQNPAGERAQPQLHRLRALAEASRLWVALVDEPGKVVTRLGGALPVAIDAGPEWESTAEELDDLFLGDAELWRRAARGEAEDPRGGSQPYVSAEKHTLIDLHFGAPDERAYDDGLRLVGEPAGYAEISEAIQAVPGVIAHGLFVNIATSAVVATADGPRVIQRDEQSASQLR